MSSKSTHTPCNRYPNTPRGSSFPAWLSARFNVPPATARLLAERAGYVIRDEWAPIYPAAAEVVASAAKAMGAAHG
ncbi:MAG TPA: hypothetical protein VGU72_09755 [Beijerinckiaceae bacterium]|nr:hypothetical protein [Beijerinckiaceae bacterium]